MSQRHVSARGVLKLFVLRNNLAPSQNLATVMLRQVLQGGRRMRAHDLQAHAGLCPHGHRECSPSCSCSSQPTRAGTYCDKPQLRPQGRDILRMVTAGSSASARCAVPYWSSASLPVASVGHLPCTQSQGARDPLALLAQAESGHVCPRGDLVNSGLQLWTFWPGVLFSILLPVSVGLHSPEEGGDVDVGNSFSQEEAVRMLA